MGSQAWVCQNPVGEKLPAGTVEGTYCKGDCGAELNRVLAGGPKLIYYYK